MTRYGRKSDAFPLNANLSLLSWSQAWGPLQPFLTVTIPHLTIPHHSCHHSSIHHSYLGSTGLNETSEKSLKR